MLIKDGKAIFMDKTYTCSMNIFGHRKEGKSQP